jgi:acyl carrier protein
VRGTEQLEESCANELLMTRDDIIACIAEETGVPTDLITADTRLDVLAEDSLEFVSLIVALRNRFGADIPNEIVAEIHTVGDLFVVLRATEAYESVT